MAQPFASSERSDGRRLPEAPWLSLVRRVTVELRKSGAVGWPKTGLALFCWSAMGSFGVALASFGRLGQRLLGGAVCLLWVRLAAVLVFFRK